MIEALFTDLGDVMFLFDHDEFHDEIRRITGRIPERLDWDKSAYHAKAQTGRINGKTYLEKRAQELGIKPQTLLSLWERIVSPNEGYLTFLRDWKRSGRKLYLLSNINVVAWGHYRDRPIFQERIFDDLFLSYRMRVMKPHPRIFERCLEKTSLPAERVLFIDDLPKNVEVAGQVGLNTWLYRKATHDVFMDFVTPLFSEPLAL